MKPACVFSVPMLVGALTHWVAHFDSKRAEMIIGHRFIIEIYEWKVCSIKHI